MPPIVHIGPPKTASTSIQNSIVPKLGRPFAVKPDWVGTLCRSDVFFAPPPPADLILSDEYLGEFSHAAPETICDRLSQLFQAGARVVHVHRDPLELFTSYYRQKIVNTVTGMDRALEAKFQLGAPTADQFFDQHVAQFEKSGSGFLAMANTKAVRAAFARRFDVMTLDFAQVRTDRSGFAAAFCKACDSDQVFELSSENMASISELEAAIRALPPMELGDLPELWLASYRAPELSRDRQAVLKAFEA